LWLNEDLHRSSQKPVLVFMHHPPSTRASLAGQAQAGQRRALLEIIPPYSRNILGVFAAHLTAAHLPVRGVLPPVAGGELAIQQQCRRPRAALSEERRDST